MKHESKFGAHIGTSSLLLIFLTLALVSFGALSLAGAIADKRLSDKLLTHTQEYYTADHEAEAFVARSDAAARKARETAADESEYFRLLGGKEASIAVPMNESQDLVVRLAYVYPSLTDLDNNVPESAPDADSEVSSPYYHIVSWCIENHDDMSYERHLPVNGSGLIP
ncbi:MAG: hypothetical protein K6B72_11065 [Lachnospiraceae bacterium]|nr:hypothetical protein [Lachnospiraceae bacterium]